MVAYAKNPVKLIDEPLRMSTASNDYYYAHDHLYSVSALIDDSGSVVERYEYDAYGNCHVLDTDFSVDADNTSDYGNVYTFQGKTLDILDSGNLRVMAWPYRNYLPGIGRWLQYDKLGMIPNDDSRVNPFDIHRQYDDGVNIYGYLSNNPENLFDPYGLIRVGGPGQQEADFLICIGRYFRWDLPRECAKIVSRTITEGSECFACVVTCSTLKYILADTAKNAVGEILKKLAKDYGKKLLKQCVPVVNAISTFSTVYDTVKCVADCSERQMRKGCSSE